MESFVRFKGFGRNKDEVIYGSKESGDRSDGRVMKVTMVTMVITMSILLVHQILYLLSDGELDSALVTLEFRHQIYPAFTQTSFKIKAVVMVLL